MSSVLLYFVSNNSPYKRLGTNKSGVEGIQVPTYLR